MNGKQWITTAELYRNGKVIRRYVLKQDEKGFYFEGAQKESFRRKNRAKLETGMEKMGFDIVEMEPIN